MNKEDVIYNLEMSIFFYLKETFAIKYNLFSNDSLKINKTIKNKEYQLPTNILVTDGNYNPQELEVLMNGEILDKSNYFINYNTKTIKFNDYFNIIEVKYKILDIDLISEYPDSESSSFEKQIIAVEISDYHTSPFEIGGTRQYWKIRFYIDLFCFSHVMRKLFGNTLSVCFKNYGVPLINFKENNIVLTNGNLNTEFSLSNYEEVRVTDFGNILVESLNMESQEKKKMYNSCVSGTITLAF
jgi:hypothetical protein